MSINSPLIGRQANLTHNTRTIDGQVYTFYTLVDDDFAADVAAMYGEDARIQHPGWGGTMDWEPSRVNVILNEDGLVTDVRYG